MITVAKNEIITAIRSRTAVILAIIFYLLAFAAIFSGWKNLSAGSGQRKQAKEMFRKEWTEQEANPHSAAHFGTYLFKPLTFISLFDTGLNNYTGNSYRVEAHHQAEMNYAAAQDSDAELRFGELTVATLFQLFVPLLIIFLCFRSVAAERENQTLKLLIAQGIRPSALLWGKIAGNYVLLSAIVLPVMVLSVIATAIREPSMLSRIISFNVLYLVYFLILTCIFISVSALNRNSKNALLSSLGLWVLCLIMLPKLAAGITSALYPLPSRGEFNKMVETTNTKGLAGDKDRMARYQDYLHQTLAKYKVDSASQLPFNFDGLSMQNSEDYYSRVYLTINAKVEQKIQAQKKLTEIFGFLDPFLSVQQVSMTLAGSDYAHHIDFHKRAQAYRDNFIRKLNIKMAYGDKRYLKYDYTVGPDFFRTIRDFNYQQPGTGWALSQYQYSLYALLAWVIACLLTIYFISKKLVVY